MSNHVPLSSLEVGSAFIATWRENKNIGELVEVGPGSCTVRIPDGESGWDRLVWAKGTMVVPTTREEFLAQVTTTSNRVRSAAESPVAIVHGICDKHKASGKVDRDAIIKECVEAGVNINTAKTQFYAWRKKA